MTQATYNRPPWQRTKTFLNFLLEAVILLVSLVGLYFGILIVAALMEPLPTPETREFTTAVHSENYSRTQRDWGDN
jgi:hypothetical protein